jgi:hypothetical protein
LPQKRCGLGKGDQRGTKPHPEAACADRRIERSLLSHEEAARFCDLSVAHFQGINVGIEMWLFRRLQ